MSVRVLTTGRNDIRSSNHGSMHFERQPAGKYHALVIDSHDCVSRVEMTLEEHNPEVCPDLAVCQNQINYHPVVYSQCLRKVAWPLLWSKKWNHCQARAALDLMKHLHVPFNRDDGNLTEFYGAASIALIVGEALDACEKEQGVEACDFGPELLEVFLEELPQVRMAFRQRRWREANLHLLGLTTQRTVTVRSERGGCRSRAGAGASVGR